MITLNRRQFLATSAAFSGLSASTGFAGTPFATLTAQQSDVQLLPGNYGKTSLWCFDGGSPGPEIRVAHGGACPAQIGQPVFSGNVDALARHPHRQCDGWRFRPDTGCGPAGGNIRL